MTSRRMERKQRNTRSRILNAARTLFDRDGFEATSVEAIADKADVSVGTIYNFFHTKTDLLSEVLRAATASMLQQTLSAVTAPADNPLEATMDLVTAYFQSFAQVDRSLLRIAVGHGVLTGSTDLLGARIDWIDDHISAQLVAAFQTLETKKRFTADVDIHALARTIFAVGNSEFFGWLANDQDTIEDVLNRMRGHIDVILHARTRSRRKQKA